jgi:hypothetical protein
MVREGADVINQLPALQIAQLVLKGGHGEPPACNLPENLAVGSPAHRPRIGKIAGCDGKFRGLLAPPIAFLAMAAAAVLAVRLFSGRKGVCSCGYRVLQPLGRLGRTPISRGVDRDQRQGRENHKHRKDSEFSCGLTGLHESIR